MMWLYKGHMGGLFLSDGHSLFDGCYYDVCCDSDIEIGSVKYAEDVLRLLANDIAIFPEESGWDLDYVIEFLRKNFHTAPIKEWAIQWVLAHRAKIK